LVQIVEIKIPFLAKTAEVSKIRIQARRKEENNCTMSSLYRKGIPEDKIIQRN